MKAIKLVLLCLLISLVSCSKEYEVLRLESSDLSPETLEFFEYYEKTDQMVFKKEGKSLGLDVNKIDIYDASSLTKAIESNIDTDYWIFNKVGGTVIEYNFDSNGYNDTVGGNVEKRIIKYKDADENILEFKLINNSYPSTRTKSQNKLNEQFQIRYSAPCWTTLLRL